MSIDYPVENFVVFNNNGRGQITHEVDLLKDCLLYTSDAADE